MAQTYEIAGVGSSRISRVIGMSGGLPARLDPGDTLIFPRTTGQARTADYCNVHYTPPS
jgi:hypothetical protein